jgi:GNAT superfamily N-acetyltransferase
MDDLVVRRAAPGDRAFVLSLVPRLHAFGPPPLRSPEWIEVAEGRVLARAFDDPPEGSVLFVAEHRQRGPLGAAYAETAVDYFTRESHAHLSILAVAEAGEGRGAGRALLSAVEAWAAEHGFRFVTLNVFAANSRARAVYERAGYAPETLRYAKELRAAEPGEPPR